MDVLLNYISNIDKTNDIFNFIQVLPEFLSWTNSRGAGYANIIAFIVLSISLFLAIYDPTVRDVQCGVACISNSLCAMSAALRMCCFRTQCCVVWCGVVFAGSWFVQFFKNIYSISLCRTRVRSTPLAGFTRSRFSPCWWRLHLRQFF